MPYQVIEKVKHENICKNLPWCQDRLLVLNNGSYYFDDIYYIYNNKSHSGCSVELSVAL